MELLDEAEVAVGRLRTLARRDDQRRQRDACGRGPLDQRAAVELPHARIGEQRERAAGKVGAQALGQLREQARSDLDQVILARGHGDRDRQGDLCRRLAGRCQLGRVVAQHVARAVAQRPSWREPQPGEPRDRANVPRHVRGPAPERADLDLARQRGDLDQQP